MASLSHNAHRRHTDRRRTHTHNATICNNEISTLFVSTAATIYPAKTHTRLQQQQFVFSARLGQQMVANLQQQQEMKERKKETKCQIARTRGQQRERENRERKRERGEGRGKRERTRENASEMKNKRNEEKKENMNRMVKYNAKCTYSTNKCVSVRSFDIRLIYVRLVLLLLYLASSHLRIICLMELSFLVRVFTTQIIVWLFVTPQFFCVHTMAKRQWSCRHFTMIPQIDSSCAHRIPTPVHRVCFIDSMNAKWKHK